MKSDNSKLNKGHPGSKSSRRRKTTARMNKKSFVWRRSKQWSIRRSISLTKHSSRQSSWQRVSLLVQCKGTLGKSLNSLKTKLSKRRKIQMIRVKLNAKMWLKVVLTRTRMALRSRVGNRHRERIWAMTISTWANTLVISAQVVTPRKKTLKESIVITVDQKVVPKSQILSKSSTTSIRIKNFLWMILSSPIVIKERIRLMRGRQDFSVLRVQKFWKIDRIFKSFNFNQI